MWLGWPFADESAISESVFDADTLIDESTEQLLTVVREALMALRFPQLSRPVRKAIELALVVCRILVETGVPTCRLLK